MKARRLFLGIAAVGVLMMSAIDARADEEALLTPPAADYAERLYCATPAGRVDVCTIVRLAASGNCAGAANQEACAAVAAAMNGTSCAALSAESSMTCRAVQSAQEVGACPATLDAMGAVTCRATLLANAGMCTTGTDAVSLTCQAIRSGLAGECTQF
jgi:hypothetical protein